MSGRPLPFYWTVETVGGISFLAVTLDGGRELQVAMEASKVGTPSGDAAIRLAIDIHEQTRDVIRDGI